MSTLTSKDINLTRPSTRLHAPPGGKSTISFGSYEEPERPSTAPALSAPKSPIRAPAPAPAPTPAPTIKAEDSPKVGIVLYNGPGAETLKLAIATALAIEGVTGSVISTVDDPMMMTFTAQQLSSSNDAVIAAAIITNDCFGSGSLSQSLTSGLLHVSAVTNIPVIPAFVVQSSLLEAKAILSTLAPTWAKAVTGLHSTKTNLIVEAAPEIILPPPIPPVTVGETSTEILLNNLKLSLKQHGASGINGLSRKFRIADDDNSGFISLSEFEKVIAEHALDWTKAQIKLVFDFFDEDKDNKISFDEFIFGIRGQLNSRRSQIVLQAFQLLDADKSGVVEVSDIRSKYDASKHPDVIAGIKTPDQILQDFLSTFDGDGDGKVTPKEFIHYYGNVSSSIDDDDYFELMIRNAWHISGGEGWCENSTCKRVLVLHTNGSQTVEEIQNDLGVKSDDKAALIAHLQSQGITDIQDIQLSGGLDNLSEAKDPAKVPQSVAAGVAVGGILGPGSPGGVNVSGARAREANTSNIFSSSDSDSTANRQYAAPVGRRGRGGGASSIVLG